MKPKLGTDPICEDWKGTVNICDRLCYLLRHWQKSILPKGKLDFSKPCSTKIMPVGVSEILSPARLAPQVVLVKAESCTALFHTAVTHVSWNSNDHLKKPHHHQHYMPIQIRYVLNSCNSSHRPNLSSFDFSRTLQQWMTEKLVVTLWP